MRSPWGRGEGKKTERHACALHTANAAGSSDDLFPFIAVFFSFFSLVISRKKKKACSTSTGNILFFLSPPQRTVILFKCQARKAAWHLIAMLCSGTARQLELISPFFALFFFFVFFFSKKKRKTTFRSLPFSSGHRAAQRQERHADAAGHQEARRGHHLLRRLVQDLLLRLR